MKKFNWMCFSLCLVLGLPPLARSGQPGSLAQLESLFKLSGNQYGRIFDGDRQPFTSRDIDLPDVTDKTKAAGQQKLKQMMLENLDMIKNMISVQYAPADWKKQQFGWNLDAEMQKARKEVTQGELSVRDYQKIVNRLFQSMRDYHVSVQFTQTESASLPLTVMGADGKYFITGIDRDKLPASSFPFNIGDELVAFDGRPVASIIQQLKQELGASSPLTDSALASIYLTKRNASSSMEVSQGPIILTIKPAGSQTAVTQQLVWDYSPELIQLKSLSTDKNKALPIPLAWLNDALWSGAAGLQTSEETSYSIGARKSFVPALGPVIWESDEENPFYSYIYRSPADGKLIGYVRIPSYSPRDPDAAVAAFAKILARFNTATDGLVIDQVNNPGGSVLYLYTLVSMLSNQAMSTPRHKISLTQTDLTSAAKFLKFESLVKNDAAARQLLGDTLSGYPVSYEVFRNMLEFSRFVIGQWNSGKRLTDPTFINGVDYISPSAQVKYEKPVLVLVNELDFSGGDFFPAILQDNKRAVIFGTRTSGAGGYVKSITYPNQLGISNFSLTGSIAYRVDGNPIENLGVTPDIKYSPGAADFQDGFKGYGKAVNAAMSGLLK